MEKTINKLFIFIVLLFCCYTICLGQNKENILLKYDLAKKEFKNIDKEIMFSKKSLQNRNSRNPRIYLNTRDYRKIIHYDTAFSKLDTLFIILPDTRVHEKQRNLDMVTTEGTSPLKMIYRSKRLFNFRIHHGINGIKQRFVQSIPIQTDKKIVVLKSNWHTLVFEKKKGNKYKLKQVDKERFYDYVNRINGTQTMDSSNE